MKTAHIDCAAGASGDMFLGAWLDSGIDEALFRTMLEGLHISGYEIKISEVFRNGIHACKVDVVIENEELHYDGDRSGNGSENLFKMKLHHPHRHLPEIYEILDKSELPIEVRDKSKQAFRALAEAEGRVHGMPPEEVHFHEVGAIDAIVDIVGSMALWYLAGMPDCYVSPIEVGMGTVKCAHGVMPVPVPATVALLTGYPTYSSGVMGETVTPTGAAIIRTLCKKGPLPTITCNAYGYGAGSAERSIANVLRIRIGNPVDVSSMKGTGKLSEEGTEAELVAGAIREPACVLESNLDDMTPEWSSYVLAKLIELGAMDAWLTPIVMKKGRPAAQLHVLCSKADKAKLVETILRETSTLGVRYYDVEKTMWKRSFTRVETPYGSVRMKIATDAAGRAVNVAPEYEDCRAIAVEKDIPLKEIYRAAFAATDGVLQ